MFCVRQVSAAEPAQQELAHDRLQDRPAVQRLLHQLRVLHAAHGRPGGDHLRKRFDAHRAARNQLHGLVLHNAATHEPARLTHRPRQDEVSCKNQPLVYTPHDV